MQGHQTEQSGVTVMTVTNIIVVHAHSYISFYLPVKQEIGVQGHCCGPNLSNIFTNGKIAYISKKKPHVQPLEKPIIRVLLPADNSATESL